MIYNFKVIVRCKQIVSYSNIAESNVGKQTAKAEEVYSVQFNFLSNLVYLKQSWRPTDSLTDDTLNFFKTVNPIPIANPSQKNDRISCTNKCKTLRKTTRPKHLITLLIVKTLLN